MRPKVIMVLFFATYFIRELWTLFPYSPETLQPFLLSDQEITLQSYIWIACIHLVSIVVAFILYQMSTEYAAGFFQLVFILQSAEFVEYFINYNEAWFIFSGIHINVTNLRYGILFIYLLIRFTNDWCYYTWMGLTVDVRGIYSVACLAHYVNPKE